MWLISVNRSIAATAQLYRLQLLCFYEAHLLGSVQGESPLPSAKSPLLLKVFYMLGACCLCSTQNSMQHFQIIDALRFAADTCSQFGCYMYMWRHSYHCPAKRGTCRADHASAWEGLGLSALARRPCSGQSSYASAPWNACIARLPARRHECFGPAGHAIRQKASVRQVRPRLAPEG